MASQKPLHNRVDRKVLREQLAQSEQARTTVSFYKYWNIPDVQQFRDDLFSKILLLRAASVLPVQTA